MRVFYWILFNLSLFFYYYLSLWIAVSLFLIYLFGPTLQGHRRLHSNTKMGALPIYTFIRSRFFYARERFAGILRSYPHLRFVNQPFWSYTWLNPFVIGLWYPRPAWMNRYWFNRRLVRLRDKDDSVFRALSFKQWDLKTPTGHGYIIGNKIRYRAISFFLFLFVSFMWFSFSWLVIFYSFVFFLLILYIFLFYYNRFYANTPTMRDQRRPAWGRYHYGLSVSRGFESFLIGIMSQNNLPSSPIMYDEDSSSKISFIGASRSFRRLNAHFTSYGRDASQSYYLNPFLRPSNVWRYTNSYFNSLYVYFLIDRYWYLQHRFTTRGRLDQRFLFGSVTPDTNKCFDLHGSITPVYESSGDIHKVYSDTPFFLFGRGAYRYSFIQNLYSTVTSGAPRYHRTLLLSDPMSSFSNYADLIDSRPFCEHVLDIFFEGAFRYLRKFLWAGLPVFATNSEINNPRSAFTDVALAFVAKTNVPDDEDFSISDSLLKQDILDSFSSVVTSNAAKPFSVSTSSDLTFSTYLSVGQLNHPSIGFTPTQKFLGYFLSAIGFGSSRTILDKNRDFSLKQYRRDISIVDGYYKRFELLSGPTSTDFNFHLIYPDYFLPYWFWETRPGWVCLYDFYRSELDSSLMRSGFFVELIRTGLFVPFFTFMRPFDDLSLSDDFFVVNLLSRQLLIYSATSSTFQNDLDIKLLWLEILDNSRWQKIAKIVASDSSKEKLLLQFLNFPFNSEIWKSFITSSRGQFDYSAKLFLYETAFTPSSFLQWKRIFEDALGLNSFLLVNTRFSLNHTLVSPVFSFQSSENSYHFTTSSSLTNSVRIFFSSRFWSTLLRDRFWSRMMSSNRTAKSIVYEVLRNPFQQSPYGLSKSRSRISRLNSFKVVAWAQQIQRPLFNYLLSSNFKASAVISNFSFFEYLLKHSAGFRDFFDIDFDSTIDFDSFDRLDEFRLGLLNLIFALSSYSNPFVAFYSIFTTTDDPLRRSFYLDSVITNSNWTLLIQCPSDFALWLDFFTELGLSRFYWYFSISTSDRLYRRTVLTTLSTGSVLDASVLLPFSFNEHLNHVLFCKSIFRSIHRSNRAYALWTGIYEASIDVSQYGFPSVFDALGHSFSSTYQQFVTNLIRFMLTFGSPNISYSSASLQGFSAAACTLLTPDFLIGSDSWSKLSLSATPDLTVNKLYGTFFIKHYHSVARVLMQFHRANFKIRKIYSPYRSYFSAANVALVNYLNSMSSGFIGRWANVFRTDVIPFVSKYASIFALSTSNYEAWLANSNPVLVSYLGFPPDMADYSFVKPHITSFSFLTRFALFSFLFNYNRSVALAYFFSIIRRFQVAELVWSISSRTRLTDFYFMTPFLRQTASLKSFFIPKFAGVDQFSGVHMPIFYSIEKFVGSIVAGYNTPISLGSFPRYRTMYAQSMTQDVFITHEVSRFRTLRNADSITLQAFVPYADIPIHHLSSRLFFHVRNLSSRFFHYRYYYFIPFLRFIFSICLRYLRFFIWFFVSFIEYFNFSSIAFFISFFLLIFLFFV